MSTDKVYSLYEAGLIPREYFLEALGYSEAQRSALRANLQCDVCDDCGCWTGQSDCPHCTDAPHPRGRW